MYYVQVMKPGIGDEWHQVNAWRNQATAIGDAKQRWANRATPASNLTAIRVVKGRSNLVVVFERITN